MNLRRAIVIAACLLPAAAGSAAAQAPQQSAPWPAPQQSAPTPWPGQQPAQTAAPAAAPPTAPATAPWPAPQQQQSGPSPWQQPPQLQQPDSACMEGFAKLRDEAQKRANALQAAGKHKPSAKEACGLFNAFAAAEAKLIKYTVAHTADCRVPPGVLDNMKKQHAQTNKVRGNVCRAAAAPRGPAPPSLSDALSAPIPDSNNIKTGRGTFDTLTGNPLGR
jgi:hypothetical protein